jgi:hypothetical protein
MNAWEKAPIVKYKWEDAPIIEPAVPESTRVAIDIPEPSLPGETQGQGQREGYFSNLGKYWSEDLPQAGKAVWEGVKKRGERIEAPTELGDLAKRLTGAKGKVGDVVQGIAGTPERIQRSVGGAVGVALGDIPGQALMLGAKSLNRLAGGAPGRLIGKAVKPIAPKVGEAAKAVSESHMGKTFKQLVDDLTPAEKANYGATLDMIELFGYGPAAKAGKAATSKVDDVLKAVSKGLNAQGMTDDAAKQVVKKIRGMIDDKLGIINLPSGQAKQLSEIDISDITTLVKELGAEDVLTPVVRELKGPMVKLRRDIGDISFKEQRLFEKGKIKEPLREGDFALPELQAAKKPKISSIGRGIDERHFVALGQVKNETTPDFEKLLVRANEHLRNRAVDSPIEEVSKLQFKALGEIDDVGKQLSKQKEAILQSNKGLTVDLTEVLEDWQGAVNQVLGVDVKYVKKGKKGYVAHIVDAQGRTIVDPEAAGPIKEIAETIKNIPAEVDVKYADDLKRKIQKMAYNKSTGRTPDAAKRLSRQLAHNIDAKLDNALGDQYRIINDKLRDLINLEDHMGSRLGKQINYESGLSMHSASMMKRAMQSTQDSGIKDLFRQVYKITNGKYDLFQAAAYAEAAMKAVGDSQAFSLLETTRFANMSPKSLTEMALKLAPSVVRRTSPGGWSGDAQFLLNYYKKAQSKAAKAAQKPPTTRGLL